VRVEDLLDFGIARVSRGPLLHERSGPLALTPAYASCEMLQGAEADARDDIYSFACVIYEMLSGKRPCGELNALEARGAGARAPPLEGCSHGHRMRRSPKRWPLTARGGQVRSRSSLRGSTRARSLPLAREGRSLPPSLLWPHPRVRTRVLGETA
jgi:serine/threonine protein kinase